MAARGRRRLVCLRTHAARLCHAIGAIGNIMSGVLLANGRFHLIVAPLCIALTASLLIGVLESTPGADRRQPTLATDKRGARRKVAKTRQAAPLYPSVIKQQSDAE